MKETKEKLVSCSKGHKFKIPVMDTYAKCPECGIGVVVYYRGTIGGKFH